MYIGVSLCISASCTHVENAQQLHHHRWWSQYCLRVIRDVKHRPFHRVSLVPAWEMDYGAELKTNKRKQWKVIKYFPDMYTRCEKKRSPIDIIVREGKNEVWWCWSTKNRTKTKKGATNHPVRFDDRQRKAEVLKSGWWKGHLYCVLVAGNAMLRCAGLCLGWYASQTRLAELDAQID